MAKRTQFQDVQKVHDRLAHLQAVGGALPAGIVQRGEAFEQALLHELGWDRAQLTAAWGAMKHFFIPNAALPAFQAWVDQIDQVEQQINAAA